MNFVHYSKNVCSECRRQNYELDKFVFSNVNLLYSPLHRQDAADTATSSIWSQFYTVFIYVTVTVPKQTGETLYPRAI